MARWLGRLRDAACHAALAAVLMGSIALLASARPGGREGGGFVVDTAEHTRGCSVCRRLSRTASWPRSPAGGIAQRGRRGPMRPAMLGDPTGSGERQAVGPEPSSPGRREGGDQCG
jgi:hypothetical protein